jgi:hypothetical protein
MNSSKNTYILAYFMVTVASSWSTAIAEGGLKFPFSLKKVSTKKILLENLLPSRFAPFAKSATRIAGDLKTKIRYNVQDHLSELLKESDRYFESFDVTDPFSIAGHFKPKRQEKLNEVVPLQTKPNVKKFDDLSPDFKKLLKKIDDDGFITTIWHEIATTSNGWHYKVTGNYDKMTINLDTLKPFAQELNQLIEDPTNPKNIIPAYHLILRSYDQKDAGKNTENKIHPKAVGSIFDKIVYQFKELVPTIDISSLLKECPNSKYIIEAFNRYNQNLKQKIENYSL